MKLTKLISARPENIISEINWFHHSFCPQQIFVNKKSIISTGCVKVRVHTEIKFETKLSNSPAFSVEIQIPQNDSLSFPHKISFIIYHQFFFTSRDLHYRLYEYELLFSLVQASSLSPRFGPKRNSKMPFDHHPPPTTANF